MAELLELNYQAINLVVATEEVAEDHHMVHVLKVEDLKVVSVAVKEEVLTATEEAVEDLKADLVAVKEEAVALLTATEEEAVAIVLKVASEDAKAVAAIQAV